jgi:hypothetical protein
MLTDGCVNVHLLEKVLFGSTSSKCHHHHVLQLLFAVQRHLLRHRLRKAQGTVAARYDRHLQYRRRVLTKPADDGVARLECYVVFYNSEI